MEGVKINAFSDITTDRGINWKNHSVGQLDRLTEKHSAILVVEIYSTEIIKAHKDLATVMCGIETMDQWQKLNLQNLQHWGDWLNYFCCSQTLGHYGQ